MIFFISEKALEDYDKKLSEKDFIIVGNKIDEEAGKANLQLFTSVFLSSKSFRYLQFLRRD